MELHDRKIGFLVPSSNTVLEPYTWAMGSAVPDLSMHFSRLEVTEISLQAKGLSQFQNDKIVSAARLLSHAKVDLVAWHGTAGSWLGLKHDRDLCLAVENATGLKATTSTLAFHELFKRRSLRRIGLVTPYTRDVQDGVVRVWGSEGIDCVGERHLGIQENYAFGQIPESVIEEMIRDVARSGCDAVAIVCTNMRGARISSRLEAELNIPVLDSVAVTLRSCLDMLGLDARKITGWGSVFTDFPDDRSLGDRLTIAPR